MKGHKILVESGCILEVRIPLSADRFTGHREFRRNAHKLPGLGPKWSCFGEPWNLLRSAAVIADEAAEA